MTTVHNSQTGWPIGFRIRPLADPESADVEVADTVTGRRFRYSPEELSTYILGGGDANGAWAADAERIGRFNPADGRDRQLSDWQHWQARGWHPSDQFYAASRCATPTQPIDDADSSQAPAGSPPPEIRPVGPTVPLDEPAPPGTQPVSQLLVTRRTGRAYVPKPVPVERLSGLLWHGLADVRERRARIEPGGAASAEDGYGSAWEVCLCVYNVSGLAPGSYRYDLRTHQLTSIRPGDHRKAMIDVFQGMHSPWTAAWTIGLVADFPRYQWWHRGEHGLRRLYIESGILAQELIILGMSYGVSTMVTPAQKDSPYLALHGLTDERRFAPIYTLTMGPSRGQGGIYDERPTTESVAGAS
jgi:hypothetical protein